MSTPFLPEYLPEGANQNYITPPVKKGPARNGAPASNSANAILKRMLDLKAQMDVLHREMLDTRADFDLPNDISSFDPRP